MWIVEEEGKETERISVDKKTGTVARNGHVINNYTFSADEARLAAEFPGFTFSFDQRMGRDVVMLTVTTIETEEGVMHGTEILLGNFNKQRIEGTLDLFYVAEQAVRQLRDYAEGVKEERRWQKFGLRTRRPVARRG